MSRTRSRSKDTDKSVTVEHPYSPAMKNHGSNSKSSSSETCSSSISSRETHQIHRLAGRLARVYKAWTTSLLSSNTSSAKPNAEAEKRSSLDKGVAGDAPRDNTDISQQGSEDAHKHSEEVRKESSKSPSRGVNKPRSTPLSKLSASNDDFLLCRYCGQYSRVVDFTDRLLTLGRPTQSGIPPSRTQVRCRRCYSAMPVSPLVRPKTTVAPHQQKKLVSRGKRLFLNPATKKSTLRMTLKIMMNERLLKEEKDENKKRKQTNMLCVNRDVLLMKLHMRRAVLGEEVAGSDVTNDSMDDAEWQIIKHPFVKINRSEPRNMD